MWGTAATPKFAVGPLIPPSQHCHHLPQVQCSPTLPLLGIIRCSPQLQPTSSHGDLRAHAPPPPTWFSGVGAMVGSAIPSPCCVLPTPPCTGQPPEKPFALSYSPSQIIFFPSAYEKIRVWVVHLFGAKTIVSVRRTG